jgi:hypothetical protein
MFLGILFLLIWYGEKKRCMQSKQIYLYLFAYFLLRIFIKIISYSSEFFNLFAYYSLFFAFEELFFLVVISLILLKNKKEPFGERRSKEFSLLIFFMFVLFVFFDVFSSCAHSITIHEEKRMTADVFSYVEKIKEGISKKELIGLLGKPITGHKYGKVRKDSVGRVIDEELQYVAFLCYKDYRRIYPFKRNKYTVGRFIFYFYKNKLIEIEKAWPQYFSNKNRFIIHSCFYR